MKTESPSCLPFIFNAEDLLEKLPCGNPLIAIVMSSLESHESLCRVSDSCMKGNIALHSRSI